MTRHDLTVFDICRNESAVHWMEIQFWENMGKPVGTKIYLLYFRWGAKVGTERLRVPMSPVLPNPTLNFSMARRTGQFRQNASWQTLFPTPVPTRDVVGLPSFSRSVNVCSKSSAMAQFKIGSRSRKAMRARVRRYKILIDRASGEIEMQICFLVLGMST